MRLGDLQGAGRTPPLPLTIEDAEGDGLELQRLLRVLPGQRYVGMALWRGQRVLAKLLVGAKAQRHHKREVEGARLLAEQALTTPRLLAQGYRSGEGGWLLFEFLEEASSLGDEWRALSAIAPLDDTQQTLLGEALASIAALHARGLWQDDLHLDNLMRHAGRLYLVDGGAVRAQVPGSPLSREQALDNLGVFFGQFPASLDAHVEELLVHYLLVNGEHALPLEALLGRIGRVRAGRLRDYLRKIGRDCSLFSARRGPSILQVIRRADQAWLEPLLAHPDRLVDEGQALKRGGSSTVVRFSAAGRTLVLKRYNIKGFGHWLKRFWRPSRAWHSWREGHRLTFLGLVTPVPLAVLERRTCWLRRQAYLITEHAAGEDIIARFAPWSRGGDVDFEPLEPELRALDALFAGLLRERISHGDMKGTNLLWQDGRWMLIDLDAMQPHRQRDGFAKAYARDRARLLRNWPADSALYRLLDRRLPRLNPDS